MAGEIQAPAIWQTDPARVHWVAVAQTGRMYVYQHVPPREFSPSEHLVSTLDGSLRDMVLFARHEQCASLWLMSPAWGGISAELRDLLDDPPAGTCTGELSSDGHLVGVRIWREEDGKKKGAPFVVYLTDTADHWGIAGKRQGATPAQLAEALMLAAYALDMQLRFSPSTTGAQIMRQVLGKSKCDILPLSDWARELVMAHRPTYVQWSREIPAASIETWTDMHTHQPDHGCYVYKYDRNSSFVASAGEVPVGDPVYTDVYQPGCPGLYHAVVTAPDDWPATVPGIFHTGEGAGEYTRVHGEIWAWEPQIRLALQRGWSVEIAEGWYWPKSQKHNLLRPWRERIWHARELCEGYGGVAGSIAKSIVKKAGVAAIGRLMQQRGRAVVTADEAEERDLFVLWHEVDRQGRFTGLAEVEDELGRTDLVQPHWWSTIIAGANERLHNALYEHGMYHPIAAYVDAVYCLSPWPDEHLSTQLGKFKLERSMWLTAEQVAEYNALDSTALRVKYLAHQEGQDGETE